MRKRLTALVTALLLVLGMLPAGALANAMEAWTTDRVVEPTCTEQGYTVESNFITMETRNVNYTDPLGHAWGEWETEDATCEQDGYRQRKCSRCGTYEVQEIPAGHQMGAWHQVTANETIEMENDLLRYENEQKEERARVDARNRLYERAAREVYPAQKRLEALIDQAQPGTDGFRGKMAEICVLNAYIKRRANFVLLSEERSGITAAEMRAALSESAVYLGYCGTAATVDCEAEKDIPFATAAAVLDTYEAAAEALLGRASYLWIRLRDGELKMIADCAELPETGETPLAAEPGDEDGSACWTIRWEGGAANVIAVTHPCSASLATMDGCNMGLTKPFPLRDTRAKGGSAAC